MKKGIRKIISDNIILISLIGIICGIITLVLATLCMNGTDLSLFVVIAAAITVILSAVAALIVIRMLSKAVFCPVEKLAAGEEAVTVAGTPEEIEKIAETLKGGVTDSAAVNEYIGKLAEGDFAAQLPESLTGTETGEALIRLSESLNRAFGTFTRSAQLSDVENTTQVTDAFAALSAGAEEQAGVLQELSTSVDSIKETVVSTYENAAKANKFAADASAEIEAGNAHMQGLLAAMDNISKSTDEITKFVKVIEDIAFQTNLLALNSSVEAARAGGAGKGFAVVAGEVKNLANKSQDAARKTTAVIAECVKNVREGVAKTGETAKSLAAIAEETNEVSRLVSVISQSCDEQKDAIVRIDESVDRIGAVAQRNETAVQVCAASAQQMTSCSDSLRNEIANFRFKPEEKPAAKKSPKKKTAVKKAVTEEVKAEKAEKTEAAEKVEKAEKPAVKTVAPAAPRPVTIKKESYANAEFVETPDSKY